MSAIKFISSVLLSMFAIASLADSATQNTPVKQKAELGSSISTNKVELKTSEGDIMIELDEKAAPITVANFLQYVDSGFYNNTLFHRVIAGFMIQGGGMTASMVEKTGNASIKNESANGLKNRRGTIAMARKQMPDSATSQFYINLADNPNLDGSKQAPGYAVFGKVTAGMDIVDKIAAVPTRRVAMFRDVPAKDIVIISASRVK